MAEPFPLADISQAYERVANGQVRFRALIRNETEKKMIQQTWRCVITRRGKEDERNMNI